MIVLDYKKNSKFEIEFTNLDKIQDGDNVVLNLQNGDVVPLIKAYSEVGPNCHFFIPYLANLSLISDTFLNISFGTYNMINCSVFDCGNDSHIKSILPKWNIPEDNTLLFLNDDDYSRYVECIDFSKHAPELNNLFINLYPNADGILEDIKGHEKISIIIPELHAENKSCIYHIKENIETICKKLKEKYGVKRIELFISHCFVESVILQRYLDEFIMTLKNALAISGGRISTEANPNIIDKITTTNSTGILEIQKNDTLEVVDCVKFFKN
jgi:hypothetical protein